MVEQKKSPTVSRLYEKAKKLTAKLNKVNDKAKKLEAQEEVTATQQAFYYPATEPMIETCTSSENLLMPPQEQSKTYTFEQVQTLLQMERERVQANELI